MSAVSSAPEPIAHADRLGRFTWRVYITHGIIIWGPDGYGYKVLGEKRAIKKAKRMLESYMRKYTYQNGRKHEITFDKHMKPIIVQVPNAE